MSRSGGCGSLRAHVEAARFECEVAERHNAELRQGIDRLLDDIRAVDRQIGQEREHADRLRVSRAGFLSRRGVYSEWADSVSRTTRRVAFEIEDGTCGRLLLEVQREDERQSRAQVLAEIDAAIDETRNELARRTQQHDRVLERKRRMRDLLLTEYHQAVTELQVSAGTRHRFR